MAGWIALITAVAGCGYVITRAVLQYKVVLWSLEADKDGRRHARKVLKILQDDRPTASDRVRVAIRKIPRSGNDSSEGDGGALGSARAPACILPQTEQPASYH